MPKPTKVRILEYLYTVSSIPRKQLKLAFQDVAYNTVFRATKELLDCGYIELLSVSKGPTRIKITKAGMDYLSKQKDAVMQANIRSTVTSSSKKERNFNGVNVSLEELKALPISGYMALNREDEGYSIKGTSDEYDTAEEIDRNIQDYT